MNANEFEKISTNQELKARAAFDASVRHVDTDTRRRLRDARAHALQPVSSRQRPSWALPLGVAFASALALVVFWPHASINAPATANATHGVATVAAADQSPDNANVGEDSSVDSALAESLIGDSGDGADPELLGNLDFYGWLAKQPALGSGG